MRGITPCRRARRGFSTIGVRKPQTVASDIAESVPVRLQLARWMRRCQEGAGTPFVAPARAVRKAQTTVPQHRCQCEPVQREDADLAICAFHVPSGRQDSNLRPLGPHPSALPDCATPRNGGAPGRRASVRIVRVSGGIATLVVQHGNLGCGAIDTKDMRGWQVNRSVLASARCVAFFGCTSTRGRLVLRLKGKKQVGFTCAEFFVSSRQNRGLSETQFRRVISAICRHRP